MSKYIKYSLMFVFAFCSIFIIRQQSVQAVGVDDMSSLTYYDLANSTKDTPAYFSLSNTYLKGLVDEAYNTDGFDISGYNYFVSLISNKDNITRIYYYFLKNSISDLSVGKISNEDNYYYLFSHTVVSYASFVVTISGNSANMTSVTYSTDKFYVSGFTYSGVSSNMSFASTFGTTISATQYTSPTLTWSGNYSTDYSIYYLYASINTPNHIKYFISKNSETPSDVKDFPTGGKLQVNDDCKIWLYGVDGSGTRCTVNYEVDVNQIGNPSEAGQLLGFNLQLRKDKNIAYINPVLPSSETSYYSCYVKVMSGLDVIDGSTLTSDFTSTPFNTEISITAKKDVASSYVLLFEVRDKNGLVCLDQTLTVFIDKSTGNITDTDNSDGTVDISTFPVFPKGSLNPFDYVNYVWDVIKWVFNYIVNIFVTLGNYASKFSSLLVGAFSWLPTPIPELLVAGVCISVILLIVNIFRK